uniref:hypothetical protein n=1 Tax=Alistipes sp. TaxID=1872444 RepID=UPI0040578681
MKKNFLYFLMAAVTFMFAACTTPDNGGGNNGEGGNEGGTETPVTPPALEANTYAVNGTVSELKSVALAQMDEYIYLVGTPTAGVTSAEAMFECAEYVYFLVGPALVGKEFDLMTETETFTVMSNLAGATLEGLAAGETGEISAGKATFTYEKNVATVKANLTLANGTTFNLYMTAEQQVVVNENTIARGDEEKPLRAAFYMEEEGYTYLYFTPGDISYFTEIYDTTWFMYIAVPSSCVNGEKQTLSAETLMMFGMSDNVDYDNYVELYGEYLEGATGDYTISKKGEGQYAANVNFTINGVLYKISFDGTCVSALAEPEKKTNYLKYGGEEYTISAATFTEGNELYTFTFTTSLGKDIVLTAPDIAFGGDSYGFSQSEKFTVTFDGRTYSKANGDNGTMTAYYKTRSQELELQFTDYNGFEFNYTGSVTVQ